MGRSTRRVKLGHGMRWLLVCAAFLGASIGAPAIAQAPAQPLFASEELLKLRIEAPFDELLRGASVSPKPFDARLTVQGPTPESFAIRVSARGVSRRNPATCEFPPLRIEFVQPPEAASLFAGQKELKLATHCRTTGGFQNYNLLEFAAYRLLNILTPVSFKVRQAQIDYVEARTGSLRTQHLGFLVEDLDALAARNGLKEFKTEKIERAQLDAGAAARSDLFQYMIGNQDWSDRWPTAGKHCCHNIKLLGPGSSAEKLVPVAYDFDSSGFVDAPYALPPSGVPIATVRTRNYRGLCLFNPQAIEAARLMLEKRAELLDSVTGTPFLGDRSKQSARRYLEEFFAEIADAGQLKRHILDQCRN